MLFGSSAIIFVILNSKVAGSKNEQDAVNTNDAVRQFAFYLQVFICAFFNIAYEGQGTLKKLKISLEMF